jgi:integrase
MPLRELKGRWQYRFQVNGKIIEKLTDWAATEENRAKAEQKERRHRDAVLKGEVPAPARSTGRRFNETTEEFLQWLESSRIKESSVRRIKVSMVSLRVFFDEMDIGKIRLRDVEDYKRWRLKGGPENHSVKPITAKHDLAALSKFFSWAIKMQIIASANPVKDVEKPSDPDGETRMHIITPAEEMDYFDRAEKAGYRNLADVTRLILEQGMRPEEVMHLEKRGVNLETGHIQIFKGKTKAARRRLKLTPISLGIIARRMWDTASDKWLFPSPKTKTRAGQPITKLNGPHDKICKARTAKDDESARPMLDFVLYDFRHTFATRSATEKGMDLPTLKFILGHSSLRMVERYVHPTQDHVDAEMVRISTPTAIAKEVEKAVAGSAEVN